MSVFASGGWHSRTAARGNASASADCSRRQCSNCCACRRQGHGRNLALGWSDHVSIPIETNVAFLHGGASSATVVTIGRTSTCRAIHASAPSFVRPVLAHRPAGLVSRGVPASSASGRAVDRVGTAPLGGLTESSWFFRTQWSGEAHFGSGSHSVSSRRAAACLTCHRFGLRQRDTATRRSAGHSNVPALARVLADDRLFERPSNTQMEPTRPTVLCDPFTEPRGSFATLGAKNLAGFE